MNTIITVKSKEKLYAFEIMEPISDSTIFTIVSLISQAPINIESLCETVYEKLNITLKEINILAEISLN